MFKIKLSQDSKKNIYSILPKILIYIMMIYSVSKYYEFFKWYFSDNQKIIEEAFTLSLQSSIPMFIAIFLIHFFYYPKDIKDRANVISFPPIIFLFSMNLAFLISMSNMYYFQIYNIPEELDILRSPSAGVALIIIAFTILSISIRQFNKVNEDPIPTSSSNLIINNNIYSYSRNPMYLALLILQVGVGMLLSIIHIILFTIFTFIVLKYYVIFPEERYLENKFGDIYIQYKKTVRRWI